MKLAIKVNSGKIDDICRLLEEKKDATETITKVEGIKNLFDAMKASNEEIPDEKDKVPYGAVVLDLLDRLLMTYKKLDDLHRSSSIRSDEEKKQEDRIEELLCKIIEELSKIDREKEERI